MKNESPERKRVVARLIEGIGGGVIRGIRMGRLARDSKRRKAVIRLVRRRFHRRLKSLATRLRPIVRGFRKRVVQPVTVRFHCLRRQVMCFHRRTPVPKLRLLYYGIFAAFFLSAFLVARPGRTDAQTLRRPEPEIQKLMDETARLVSEKRLDEAEKNVIELNRLAPGEASVHTLAGAIKSLRKDFPGARADYLRALEASPGSFNAIYNLGEVDFVTADYAAAETQFRRLLRSRPQDEIILFRLFLCALLVNDDEKADIYLKRLFPAGVTPAWYYAQAARDFRNKQRPEARKFLSTAHLLYPDKTAFFDATMLLLKYQ